MMGQVFLTGRILAPSKNIEELRKMMGYSGRASLGQTRPVAAVLVLALISALLFVLSVSDGRLASAQTPSPVARAWGTNSFGQLGDDSFAPRSKQVEVKGEGGLGFLGNVTSLEGGQNHSLALKNGTVYAWGHNGFGQLGNGPTTGTGTDSDVPVQVHGAGDVGFLTDVLAVAAGSNFSLALVSDGTGDGVANDGTVWAWGDNFRGQLGNNSPASRNVPVQVHGAGDVGFLTDVVDVAAGSAHSLAVKSDGTVWAWGDNQFGQLGNGSSGLNVQSRTPVQVQGVGGSGFLTGVSSVAGGGLHSLAVKSDGTAVYAWGYNGTGGLGNGGGSDSNTPVQVKGVGGVGLLGGVTNVAAGSEHSLALKSDGTVYSWGNNNKGQLGDGSSGNQRNTPVQVSNENGSGFLAGATDVAAGVEHSLAAVNPQGTVWTWGRNEFGSLGNGSFGGNFSRPVQSIQLIGATELAAGDFHSLAVADADTTPPDTNIILQPPTNSNSSSAKFQFSSSDPGATFECSLDGPLFGPCSSPKEYVGLPEGQHTFQVRAKDIAGNVDSTPASYTWTVDTAAPEAPIIESPADGSYDNDGIFDVSGTAEPNSTIAIFEQPSGGTKEQKGTVTADGSGNWSKGLGGHNEGEYTYAAAATDAAGNPSAESNAVTVTVDKTAPTLDIDKSDGSDGVTPDNEAIGASRTTNVIATFSDVMDKDTLVTDSTNQTSTTIKLVNMKTGATAATTVSCDDPCQTVTLNPFGETKQKLAKRTVYKVTVTIAAEDRAGNALDKETSWTFKTKRR